MNEGYGAQSMTAPLRRVVMRRPGDEMAAADPAAWHYTCADRPRRGAQRARRLRRRAARLGRRGPVPRRAPAGARRQRVRLRPGARHRPRHPGAQHGQGAAPRRGRAARAARCRPEACRSTGASRATPAARAATPCGWTTTRSPWAVASARTPKACASCATCSRRSASRVLDYDLPFFTGPEACLHLLSLISPVDDDLAVAYPPLMPTAFWAELQRRGVRLLEVPEEEFLHTQATNVLAVAPRRVHHARGQPGDAAAARGGRLRGRHHPRRAALVQGRGRPDVPDAAGVARRR